MRDSLERVGRVELILPFRERPMMPSQPADGAPAAVHASHIKPAFPFHPMRRIVIILLFLLGAAEIAASFAGAFRIYSLEIPFRNAIELSPDRYREFGRYIAIFKNQWGIVAVFGLLTIIIAAMLLYSPSLRKAGGAAKDGKSPLE